MAPSRTSHPAQNNHQIRYKQPKPFPFLEQIDPCNWQTLFSVESFKVRLPKDPFMKLPPITREILLTAYRWTTQTSRNHAVRNFLMNGTFPATILFYHRVADTIPNDWSISCDNFRRHLDWVQSHSVFASLKDIRRSQQNGHRTIPMVGLTFDDGYSENCSYAIPLIVERKIPCTYFVSTHFVETGDPFPHDIAAGQALKPNTIAQIRRMASEGITIGAHSHSHIDLGQELSDQQLRTEISDSRKKLQDWSQQSVSYFAFPFGLAKNISQRAIDCVFEAGFECFLSAAGGQNWPGFDADHLQRVHGDPGVAALANWLTFDPRKLKPTSPIIYERKDQSGSSQNPANPYS
jgi:peptidoglycan/xylan/chitin deacetylase (PgdA/CDA1 family)